MIHYFKFLTGKKRPQIYTWRTSDGHLIKTDNMSITHIKNVLYCFGGYSPTTIPDPYHGLTHRQWTEVFMEELRFRNVVF